LRKAHTHEDLDGVFGQIALELSYSEFSCPSELIDVLLRKLRHVGIDDRSRQTSSAYELSDVADWERLVGKVGAEFKNHGGPNAPHTFKFFRRSDLESELKSLHTRSSQAPVVEDFPVDVLKHRKDVFMLTRQYMSSRSCLQVTAVGSHTLHGHLLHDQPQGSRPRKVIPAVLQRLVRSQCRMALQQNLITQVAADFLCDWVDGRLQRETRPARYEHLDYRWEAEEAAAHRLPVAYDGVLNSPNVVNVVVHHNGGPPEEADDVEAEAPDDGPIDLGPE
jgi:hypothetical protein